MIHVIWCSACYLLRVLQFLVLHVGLQSISSLSLCMVLLNVLISFLCSCPVLPAPLIEETVFFTLCILASFVKDKCPYVWIYLWAFFPVPLVYTSIFEPISYCLDDCSFVVQSEIKQVDSSSSILLFQDCFDYSGSFVFPYRIVKCFVLALWKMSLVI